MQDEDAKQFGELNGPNAGRVNEDTIGPVGHIQQAEHDMTTCGQPRGESSDTFTSSDDILVLPLKKKKKKQNYKLNVIPLTTIPIMRLPSPPPVSGSENEAERKARRKSNSFLASAHREPAWYEDVFDKETIENTRMNLGSLTLCGYSKRREGSDIEENQ